MRVRELRRIAPNCAELRGVRVALRHDHLAVDTPVDVRDGGGVAAAAVQSLVGIVLGVVQVDELVVARDGERARVGRVLELGDLLDAIVERQPRARVVGAAAERHEAPRLQRGLITAEDEDGALVRPHREPRAIGSERELRRGARDA